MPLDVLTACFTAAVAAEKRIVVIIIVIVVICVVTACTIVAVTAAVRTAIADTPAWVSGRRQFYGKRITGKQQPVRLAAVYRYAVADSSGQVRVRPSEAER